MKTEEENLFQGYLNDSKILPLLEKVDIDLAENVRKGGCLHCSGKLHRARYPRKPRGHPKQDFKSPQEIYRDSFCCDQDGCRKRHTPPSVRFLGRRVYKGFVVVLISAMRQGLTSQRLKLICERLNVDRRTVERWRLWWLETFPKSLFWKAARALLRRPVDLQSLPLSLCRVFVEGRGDRLLQILQFLSPITTGSIPL